MRDILSNIRGSRFYTLMADETSDISNAEQLTICIRYFKFALKGKVLQIPETD